MKVYVVASEGCHPHAVFSSREKAEQAINHHAFIHKNPWMSEARIKEWYVITELEVDGQFTLEV